VSIEQAYLNSFKDYSPRQCRFRLRRSHSGGTESCRTANITSFWYTSMAGIACQPMSSINCFSPITLVNRNINRLEGCIEWYWGEKNKFRKKSSETLERFSALYGVGSRNRGTRINIGTVEPFNFLRQASLWPSDFSWLHLSRSYCF